MTLGDWWIVGWCAFFIGWACWDAFLWDPDGVRHPPSGWGVQ